MFEFFGIRSQALFGQLLIGLINGSFYALLSLGLAVIFGMLNIINFTHGAQYMMGAFAACLLLQYAGHRLLVGAGASRRSWSASLGIVIERAVPAAALQARPSLRPAADLRPGAHHRGRCSATTSARRACPIRCRTSLQGGQQSRLHVPAELSRLGDRRSRSSVCLATWFVIERTKLGAYLRAATENPDAGARLRHQRAAHDHADLRLRRRRSRRSPA